MVNLVDANNDHYEEYARYCLRLAAQTSDRNARVMLREMAAEWLKLMESAGLAGRLDGFSRTAHPDARG